jgi:hypothetical protein
MGAIPRKTSWYMNKCKVTTEARPLLGEMTGLAPEFGRIRDVERLYGLKRGTVYHLLQDRKIRGCVLRVKGKRPGVRLIDLTSVRSYIRSQMEEKQQEEVRGEDDITIK